jgi:hypothetical protein
VVCKGYNGLGSVRPCFGKTACGFRHAKYDGVREVYLYSPWRRLTDFSLFLQTYQLLVLFLFVCFVSIPYRVLHVMKTLEMGYIAEG